MKHLFPATTYILSSVLMIFTGTTAFAGSCNVLVVVGMEDERSIVAGDSPDTEPSVEIVVGTANAAILRERLQKVDASNIRAVFSFGVAGALDPALKPGDLLLSEQVFSQISDTGNNLMEVGWAVDNNLLMTTYIHTQKAGMKIRKGVFLGSDAEAREQIADVATNLYRTTGAHIIDNESHIAAQFANEHNLPFLAIRAVSDSVHTPLPPAALLPLDPQDGSPDGLAIAKSLLRNPLQIPALIRVAFNYQKALRTLQNYREKVGFEKLVSKNNQGCLKGSQLPASF